MSSAQDVFRRVGRGGAGNWYSKQDIEDAEKVNPEDIEAQKPTTAPGPTPASDIAAAGYSRAGRGGAGNFYDPKDTDEARRQEKEDSKRTVSALSATASTTKQAPRAGLSGRGGAGNWSSADQTALAAAAEERERRRREDLEAQVLQDVDAGLAPPPAAYRSLGREVEEKK